MSVNFMHTFKKSVLTYTGILFGILATDSLAEEQLYLLYGDHETVSIATGQSKSLKQAPSVASVITEEDIRAIGANSLEQLLESIAGLHVGLSFNRLAPVYSIRGIHTTQNPQVLLLLNGVPVRQLFSSSRPSGLRMPISNIQRIEVIRGPGSAIYGADAFAGVINLITYKEGASAKPAVFGMRTGSFQQSDAWYTDQSRHGDWTLQYNVEVNQSQGDRNRVVQKDLQTTFDSSFSTTASRAPGALDTRYKIISTSLTALHSNWISNIWLYRLSDGGVGPGAAQALDPGGFQDTDLALFDLQYKPEKNPDWFWEVQTNYLYGHSRPHFTIFPAGTKLPIGSDGNINFSAPVQQVVFTDGLIGNPHVLDRQLNLEWKAYLTSIPKHQLRLSAGFQYQMITASEQRNFGPGVIDGSVTPIDGTVTDVTGTSFNFLPDKNRTNIFATVQDEWQMLPDMELTAGIRVDSYSDFGSTINPRLALVWAMDYDLSSKLLYGSAFRAPSFNELYAVNNPGVLGNPSLKPEQINTLEFVLDYRPSVQTTLLSNVFAYDMRNSIDFVPDGGGSTSTAQNTIGQTGYGLELEGKWHIGSKLYLTANLAWQRATRKQDSKPVPDAPQQQAYLDARWKFDSAWSLSSQINWIAGRQRASTDSRSPLTDFIWMDLSVKNRTNAHWEFTGFIRNLLDVKAYAPSNGRIPDDYPLEGRNIHLEARYTWEKQAS